MNKYLVKSFNDLKAEIPEGYTFVGQKPTVFPCVCVYYFITKEKKMCVCFVNPTDFK